MATKFSNLRISRLFQSLNGITTSQYNTNGAAVTAKAHCTTQSIQPPPCVATPRNNEAQVRTNFSTSCRSEQQPVGAFQSDLDDRNTSRSFNSDIETPVSEASSHTGHHVGFFYTVPEAIVQSLNMAKLLRPEFSARCKAFLKTALMVRDPALEALEFIRNMRPEDPALKLVLYGKDGTGKSCTMAHIMHATKFMDWMIICPPRQYLWNRHAKEIAASAFKDGRIDLPQEGAEMLLAIKQANSALLAEHANKMRTQYEYTWSRREKTPKGSTLLELIDFGIERPKYSCDVVGALLKEVRLSSGEWPVKTLVAIDGVNSLFNKTSIRVDVEKPDRLPSSDVSLFHHLRRLLSSDRTNGITLVSADPRANPLTQRESFLPRYLLKEEGFVALDPFIPIEVEEYTTKEVNTALDYLIERGWIQNQSYRENEKSRQELLFLSGRNPFELDRVTRAV